MKAFINYSFWAWNPTTGVHQQKSGYGERFFTMSLNQSPHTDFSFLSGDQAKVHYLFDKAHGLYVYGMSPKTFSTFHAFCYGCRAAMYGSTYSPSLLEAAVTNHVRGSGVV